MTTGIILAGGKATRLGPLAAQLNKSLVSVGQKPMLVRQYQLLRDAGCDEVIVVVSPGQAGQVHDVAERAGLVITVVKQDGDGQLGPANALHLATREMKDPEDGAIVIFADTFITELKLPRDTVGVSPAPTERRWCHFADGQWREDVVPAGTSVAVGVYNFGAMFPFLEPIEGEMSVALNKHWLVPSSVHDWNDVGDLGALARTRRKHFISRSFNQLELSPTGVITKRGAGPGFTDERDFIWSVMDAQHRGDTFGDLYPRILGVDFDSYRLEHVDLPTLAELWLYWPMRCDTWQWLLTELTTTMNDNHWWSRAVRRTDFEHHRAIMDRWRAWDHPIKHYHALHLNGVTHLAGAKLVDALRTRLNDFALQPARTHGDLNFTNILMSPGSGYFKLLDPRGKPLPVEYDLAKLRYSYHGGFQAITHGLFDVHFDHDAAVLNLWPKRDAEVEALPYAGPAVRALEAMLFLNGAALHLGDEGLAMYLRGVEVGNAALSE